MKIEEFMKTISDTENLKKILLEGLVVGFGYALLLLIVGIPSLLLDFKNFQYITLHQIIYSLITGVTYFGI